MLLGVRFGVAKPAEAVLFVQGESCRFDGDDDSPFLFGVGAGGAEESRDVDIQTAGLGDDDSVSAVGTFEPGAGKVVAAVVTFRTNLWIIQSSCKNVNNA